MTEDVEPTFSADTVVGSLEELFRVAGADSFDDLIDWLWAEAEPDMDITFDLDAEDPVMVVGRYGQALEFPLRLGDLWDAVLELESLNLEEESDEVEAAPPRSGQKPGPTMIWARKELEVTAEINRDGSLEIYRRDDLERSEQ